MCLPLSYTFTFLTEVFVLAIVGFVLIALYLIAWNKSAAAFESVRSAPSEPEF